MDDIMRECVYGSTVSACILRLGTVLFCVLRGWREEERHMAEQDER